jgi:hypothetical protein
MEQYLQAGAVARFRARYADARHSPRIKQMRRQSRMQIICILCITPIAFIAVAICETLGWHGRNCVPIIAAISIGGAKTVGSYLAKKKNGDQLHAQ